MLLLFAFCFCFLHNNQIRTISQLLFKVFLSWKEVPSFLYWKFSCSIFFLRFALKFLHGNIFDFPIWISGILIFDWECLNRTFWYFLNGIFAFSLLFKLNWKVLNKYSFSFLGLHLNSLNLFEQKWFESKILFSFYLGVESLNVSEIGKSFFRLGYLNKVLFTFFISFLAWWAAPPP